MIDSNADNGKLMRRKRMKSNLVSSGTMRSRRMNYFPLRMIISENQPPLFGIMRVPLNRHALRAPPAHPVRDDQARQGKGGKNCRDNPDAQGNSKTADWTGTDIKQHGRRDECGDVGIENSGESARKSCIDGIDRCAAAAHLLANSLIDQHVRVDGDTDS